MISKPFFDPQTFTLTYLVYDSTTRDAIVIDPVLDYDAGGSQTSPTSVEKLVPFRACTPVRPPDATRVFVGHDYQPGGRQMRFETTIGRATEENIQLRQSTTEEIFVRFRNERDATLSAPKLLFPSVQVNMNAGRLPRPHENGRRYLSIPINLFRPTGDDGMPPEEN